VHQLLAIGKLLLQYDELLFRYGDRAQARQEVRARIEGILAAWSAQQ
jgi:hypothetical protein